MLHPSGDSTAGGRGDSSSPIGAHVQKSLSSWLGQGYATGLRMQLGAIRLSDFQLKQMVVWTLITLAPALYCLASTADNFSIGRDAGISPKNCSASHWALPVNASEPLTKYATHILLPLPFPFLHIAKRVCARIPFATVSSSLAPCRPPRSSAS
jgi:hypothetical protein